MDCIRVRFTETVSLVASILDEYGIANAADDFGEVANFHEQLLKMSLSTVNKYGCFKGYQGTTSFWQGDKLKGLPFVTPINSVTYWNIQLRSLTPDKNCINQGMDNEVYSILINIIIMDNSND